MAANRVFTMLAVSSLALGIGANTAIYSFMDAILLRSLPVSDPGVAGRAELAAKAIRLRLRHEGHERHQYDDSGRERRRDLPLPGVRAVQEEGLDLSRACSRTANTAREKDEPDDRRTADLASGWNVSGDYFRGLAVFPPAPAG